MILSYGAKKLKDLILDKIRDLGLASGCTLGVQIQ